MTEYTEGFIYKGVKFAWKNKKLFRLPIIKDGREYGLRLVPKINITDKVKGYRICREKKSLQQIRRMTKKVNYKVTEFECRECA